MTQNEHVYAICCQLLVDDDVIFRWNIKTVEGYVAVNFEATSFSSLMTFPKRSFCDSEVGRDSGGVNAICSRPEVPNDVIYSD